MLFSYIKSTHPPSGAFSPIYVPLLNLNRSGLRLRSEFATACLQAGVNTAKLLTLDDLPPDVLGLSSIRWIIVDHNKLTGRLRDVSPKSVLGAIDHHEEENFVPQSTDPHVSLTRNLASLFSHICVFTAFTPPSFLRRKI